MGARGVPDAEPMNRAKAWRWAAMQAARRASGRADHGGGTRFSTRNNRVNGGAAADECGVTMTRDSS